MATVREHGARTLKWLVERWCEEHPGRWRRDMARKLAEWNGGLRLSDVVACDRDCDELGTLGAFADWLRVSGARRVRACECRDAAGGVVRRRREWREGASAQTVRHALAVAVRMFRWAAGPRRAWLRPEQVGGLPRTARPVCRPRDIGADRVRELFAAGFGPADALVRFVFATGARPGEACGLEWGDVDLSRGVAVLRRSKTDGRTGESRLIFLTAAAAGVLAGLGERRAGVVFLNVVGRPFTTAQVGKIVRRRGVTTYQGRHTFAQAVLEQFGIEDVARLLGHRDLRMAQVYARVRDARARAVTARLVVPGCELVSDRHV